MRESKLRGKVVLVTGAARGIGQTICDELVRLGAKVVATDILPIEERGYYKRVTADISIPEEAIRVAKEAGDVDFLINNAGIVKQSFLLSTRISDFKKVMSVNVDAPLLMTQVIARNMIKRKVKGSAIVNVASAAGMAGMLGMTSYSVSKAALIQLTR